MQVLRLMVVLTIVAAVAITIGTGAFSTVSADRSATVSVTGDESALLQLTPYTGPDGNGGIADISSGQLQISNLNVQSSTTFENVFNITNHGTQTVAVWITEEGDHTEAITFYNPSYGGTSTTENGVNSVESQSNAVTIDVGETLIISLVVNTEGFDENVALLDEMIIHADATISGGAGPGDQATGEILVCHTTNSQANPTVTLEINENALQAHLNHGDTLGAC